jgi:dihydrofolate reductase
MNPCCATPGLWSRGPANCKTCRMGKLIYSPHASLDGYTVDATGNFDFTAPDDEVLAFINDLLQPIGTFLFGRKMYETMSVWETWDTSAEPRAVKDFAKIWQRTNKVIYSRGLHTVGTRLTRIEREFTPDEVRAVKEASTENLEVGGATLGAEAFRAGLVDELHIFLSPVIVGGGTRALPDDVRLNLSLLNERHFESGVVYLHYEVGR